MGARGGIDLFSAIGFSSSPLLFVSPLSSLNTTRHIMAPTCTWASKYKHSIWISTEVDLQGNFVEVIKVSLHPKTEDKLRPKVPASMDGYEIRLEPWPKALT